MVAAGWGGIGAPAGVPAFLVRRLNAEIVRIVNLPDVRESINAVGGEPRTSTPAEFQDFIAGEMRRWGPVIVQAGAVQD